MYNIIKANNWFCSDEEAEKRLKTGQWVLLADYGTDEKFLAYVPYIPLQITKL